MAQTVVEKGVIHVRSAANTMERLLEHRSGYLLLPDGTPARLAAFAHHDVAKLQSVYFELIVLESHCSQFVQFEFAPSDVDVRKIGHQFALVLVLIEHLTEAEISNFF